MQLINSLSLLLGAISIANAAPIIITREHTAQAVTVTTTYSTKTNIVIAPTVEVFVSNGVTYTNTLVNDAQFTQPTTFTTVFNDPTTTAAADPATPETTTLAPATVAADTQAQAQATTTSPAAVQAADPTTTTAAATTPEADTTTQAAAVDTTTQATAAADTPTTAADDTPTTTAEAQAATTTQAAAAQTTPATTTTTTAAVTSAQQKNVNPTATAAASISSVPSAIVYSPYNNDNTCKDSSTVESDLELIASVGITNIRVYAVDCNSLETVQPAAAKLGIKVNQGLWFSNAGVDSIDDGLNSLISYGKSNGWDIFDFITIGNEAVQSGYVTVDELMSKISSVKATLQSAGYSGQIATSEPPVTFEENPKLCQAEIDIIGINPHAYFDTSASASTAGTFVQGQVEIVKNVCKDYNTNIVVTETGYPSAGKTNGDNVPSSANQEIAIKQILDVMDNQVTILSTYNDYWKSPGPYGIEQSFGVIQLFEK